MKKPTDRDKKNGDLKKGVKIRDAGIIGGKEGWQFNALN